MPKLQMLDTDVLVDYLRAHPEAVRFLQAQTGPLALSAITVPTPSGTTPPRISSPPDCVSCMRRAAAPTPLRFKDYIASPKANGYQSLHTYVAGPDGFCFEVQIRSEAMHQQADAGNSAHWLNKSEQQDRLGSVSHFLGRHLRRIRLLPRRGSRIPPSD